jgi:hypothetical protein
MRVHMGVCGLAARHVLGLIGLTTIGIVAFALVGCSWGYNQALPVRLVEERVRKGMTLEAVAYALGTRPLGNHVRRATGAKPHEPQYFVTLSECGMGSWFVPQHSMCVCAYSWMEIGGSPAGLPSTPTN